MIDQKELIPMRPGDILRFHREQIGLTIDRAAEQSRIKPATLEAIETGETGSIPSVYLKGYIRNYARFLGVDPAELEGHMDHVSGAEPELRSVFTAGPRRDSSERWIKASSYVVASLLIAALAWQVTHEAVRFSQGSSMFGPGNVQTDSSEGSSGNQESLQDKRHLNASIAPVEMLNQSSRQTPGPSPAEQAWSAMSGDTTEPAIDDGAEHRLRITTSADTWIEIEDANNRSLEMDLVRADTTREYEGEAPFRIMVGRASAVVLELDNEVIDLGPHTRGNVARLTLGELAVAEVQPALTEDTH